MRKFGILAKRVLSVMRERFFWIGMNVNVEYHIAIYRRCLHCGGRKDVALLVNISTSQPLELTQLDYLQLALSKSNFKNVLDIMDNCSRYAYIYVSNNQTAVTTANLLWVNYIAYYGFP